MKKTNTLFFILISFLSSSCDIMSISSSRVKVKERVPFTEVASITPETAYFNPLPSAVNIDFPSDVDMSSVGADDFTIVSSGHCPAAPMLSWSNVETQVTILLDTVGCVNGDKIRVLANMGKVLNKAGRKGKGSHEVVFTLNTDNAPSPSLNLMSGSYSAFPGSFNLVFNDSIDMASVTPSMFNISGSGSCPRSAFSNFTVSGSTVTVNYDSVGCLHGDSIMVSINNSSIVDQDGRYGAGVVTRELRLDTIGIDPSQVSIDVLSGDVNPLPSMITLSFPSDVNMDSVTLSDFMMIGTGSCPGTVLTGISKTAQTVQLTLNSTGCLDKNELSLNVPLSGIFDHAGNPGTGNVHGAWRLLTSVPDAPVWNLANGIVGTIPSSVILNFSDTINMDSVDASSLTASSTGSCLVNPLVSQTKTGTQVSVILSGSGCIHGDSVTLGLNMGLVTNKVGTTGAGTVSRTFTLDTQGPIAPVFSADNGSFSVLPASITLMFGADTDMSTVNLTTVKANGSGGCLANALSNLVISGQSAVLTLNTVGCADQNEISLKVLMGQVKDLAGNSGVSTITKSFKLDLSAPPVPALSLAPGNMRVLPTALRFTFSPDIDMASVSLADFILQGTGNCLSNPLNSYAKSGQHVDLTFDSTACGHGDSFIITLDMSGVSNTTATSGTGIFRNVYTLDVQGPALPSSSLLGGDVISFPASLSFVFPGDTDMSTVSLADFAAVGSGSGPCSSASVTGINIVSRTADLSLSSNCLSGDGLAVKAIMSGVSDLLGNPGVGEAVVSFVLDNEGPVLPSILPASATVATMPATLSINFSSDTLMSSVGLGDFSVSGSGSCVPVLSNLILGAHSATVGLSSSGCLLSDIVTFSVNGAGITDALGNSGTGSIQTAYTLDNIGIHSSFLSFLPAVGTVMNLPASVSFTFPVDTDMGSVTVADFTSSSSGSCPASIITGITKVGYSAAVAINTSGCVTGNVVSLNLNMVGVKDLVGNAGVGIVTASYTLDNTGPQAASFNLATATYSPLPTSLIATFSNDTDMGSVSQSDFSISGTGACAASSISAFSKVGKTATLTIDRSLCVHSESYTVTLAMSGVTDAIGNAGTASPSVTFTLDNVGPSLASVNVTSGTVSSLPTSLQYTFPNDTDMNSVTIADFSGSAIGSCASNPVTNLSKAGFVATLGLNVASCANGNSVTVTLDMAGVTDALANPGVGTLVRTLTLDNVGPAMATTNVASATLSVLPSSVQYTFSFDTDMNSVTLGDFVGSGTGTCPINPVTGISFAGRVATVGLSSAGCGQGNSVSVALNMNSVADAYGNSGVGNIVRTFTLDSVGPAVATVSIPSGIFMSLPTSLNVTFSSDTDMGTVALGDFSVTGTGSCSSTPLTGISKAGQVATLTFNTTACANGSSINLNLNMANVADGIGNVGSGNVSRAYTLDNVGPSFPSVNIAPGDYLLMPTPLVFTFANDVDMSTVGLADFSGSGTGLCLANPITGVVVSGSTATVNLNILSCVLFNTITIDVNMSGIKDQTGNAGTGVMTNPYRKVI